MKLMKIVWSWLLYNMLCANPYITIVWAQKEIVRCSIYSLLPMNSSTCVVSSYGDRCFAAAGLKLRNSLPAHLRPANIEFEQFKRLLNMCSFRCWDCGALWLSVKFVLFKFSYLLLWCSAIIDHIGDHAMAEHSVLWSPDELCWAHVILPRCTQTIQILQSLTPLEPLAVFPSILPLAHILICSKYNWLLICFCVWLMCAGGRHNKVRTGSLVWIWWKFRWEQRLYGYTWSNCQWTMATGWQSTKTNGKLVYFACVLLIISVNDQHGVCALTPRRDQHWCV